MPKRVNEILVARDAAGQLFPVNDITFASVELRIIAVLTVRVILRIVLVELITKACDMNPVWSNKRLAAKWIAACWPAVMPSPTGKQSELMWSPVQYPSQRLNRMLPVGSSASGLTMQASGASLKKQFPLSPSTAIVAPFRFAAYLKRHADSLNIPTDTLS